MTEHVHEPESLRAAVAAAEAMRAGDDDPAGVAHWLLRLHANSVDFEELLRVVDRYLRFGMPDHELSEMRVLVERLRERHLGDDHSDEVDSTLPL